MKDQPLAFISELFFPETRSKICESATPFIMSGGTKLFVYGVNRSCPKDLLEDKFAKIGAVSDVYITEKGYAFVTMADEGDAQAAVDELNGTRYYCFTAIIFRIALKICFFPNTSNSNNFDC